tara:strand:- start:556 stop:1146 length:591 start_codon:yes stop_codon:yes gene_type:complete
MAIQNIGEFKQALVGGGARANLYQVTCNSPAVTGTLPGISGSGSKMQFLCRAAQLPASTMGTTPAFFRGRTINLAGDRTFEPWVITVYNDTDFQIRRSMETWMREQNSHEANTGEQRPDQYKADLSVEQLDKNGVVLYKYNFIGGFPTAVSAIDLAYDANDQIEEFSIEWQYDYWESGEGTTVNTTGRGANSGNVS